MLPYLVQRTPGSAAQQLISSSTTTTYVRRTGRITSGMQSGRQPYKTEHFHPRHRQPPRITLPRTAWVRLNRLSTGVRRFCSCLYKWSMASSAACDCGAEEQTVDHVVLYCPIHRPPHGMHGLMVLDDETTEWLLGTCPEIQRGKAVVIKN